MKTSILWLSFIVLIVFSLSPAVFAEDSESAAGKIPQEQLNAYIEVSRILSGNPSLTKEDIGLLLERNHLTDRQYDEIDRQVHDDPALRERVEKGIDHETTAVGELENVPGVRTKLKKPAE
jgi:hypothetical protein